MSSTTSPFEILGLEPSMDLDPDELEAAYLRLSRQYHPDFNPGSSGAAKMEALSRSAAINDAYRLLRNPWQQAEALIELREPGAMDQTKTLCPVFLLEAMEIRETVAETPSEDQTRLQQAIDLKVKEYFADVTARIAAGDMREAATLLHQSNYYRRALIESQERSDTDLTLDVRSKTSA